MSKTLPNRGTAASSSRAATRAFSWFGTFAALLVGLGLGFGTSRIDLRTTPRALIASRPIAEARPSVSVKVPSQAPPTAPPRANIPSPGHEVEPDSTAIPSSGSPSAEKKIVPVSGKSRLRVQRRHESSIPRAEQYDPARDREHDFSFLPTGIGAPKERLKPLKF
jgi:hypothetical protein